MLRQPLATVLVGRTATPIAMHEESPKATTTRDRPPSPLPGFESDFIREVEGLFANLPTGTASLKISRVPGHEEWPEPYFELTPSNPKASRFAGGPVATDLNLTIGLAAWREFVGFARGSRIVKGATWRQEFRWIWAAVLTGGFTESIYRDSRGEAIGWATKLLVNGKDLIIRNGRRAETFFGRARVERITYEPYLQGGGV
jgi:hypothetical protein